MPHTMTSYLKGKNEYKDVKPKYMEHSSTYNPTILNKYKPQYVRKNKSPLKSKLNNSTLNKTKKSKRNPSENDVDGENFNEFSNAF